jgi:hypothetical protein
MLPYRVNCEHKDRPRGAKCEQHVSTRPTLFDLLHAQCLRVGSVQYK